MCLMHFSWTESEIEIETKIESWEQINKELKQYLQTIVLLYNFNIYK